MSKVLDLENPDFIYQYCSAFVSSPTACNIKREITHWVTHHGVEWTVSRLKSLKNQYLHYMNGESVHFVRTHADETPYGAFRSVWKLQPRKALQLLSIYTAQRLKEVTKRQEEKFITSLEAEPLGYYKPVTNPGLRIKKSYGYGHPYAWLSSETKRTPSLRNEEIVTVPESEYRFLDLVRDINVNTGMSRHVVKHASIYAKAMWVHPMAITGSISGKPGWINKTGADLYEELSQPLLVGKIGLIQEKGAKLRAVANPFRHYQMVLKPLGDALLDVLRDLPWDCTFDQSKGVSFVQSSLRAGKRVHSIDLSDATNLFPLDIQVDLVEDIIDSMPKYTFQGSYDKVRSHLSKQEMLELLDIFHQTSRGRWSYSGPNPKMVHWTKGQPLGLYPSFASFALTHGCLLRNIEYELGLSDTFRVLGDDVVINNESVARAYLRRVTEYGCKISHDKTFSSTIFGEFAGSTITAEGLIPIAKWCGYSTSDPLGPLRALGVKGTRFIPPTVRRKVARFASAPEPIGLGLNPHGRPLSDRMPSANLHWWWGGLKIEVPTEYSLSYNERHYAQSRFWRDAVRLATHGPVVDRGNILEPDDGQALDRSIDKHVVDHIRTVNRSVVYPDDVTLESVTIGPAAPQRGRPDVKDPTVSIWKRIRSYFRESTKVRVNEE